MAILGLLVLVATDYNKNPSDIAFSVIAFVISVAALVMTTLQSISISRQVRVTSRAAELIRETEKSLQALTKQEHVVEREIRRDLAVDQEIVAVLEKFGVGKNEAQRRQVAATIAARVAPKQPKK